MIDRYHLRYFLAVVDTGNFSRAAAACNVSQPTLSVGIAKLEKSLGRPLFRRTSRRVELTDAGTRLLSHARMIEGGFAAAERDIAGAPSMRTLRLGVLSTTPRRWIEKLLPVWRSTSCGDRIEIVEGQERDLRSRLARGRIDGALMILRDERDRDAGRHLITEGYSLALSASHPQATKSLIRAEDLVNDAMILRRHCELLPETSRFFTANGIRPFFSCTTTSDDKTLSYVRASLGVTVMPDSFCEAGVVRAQLDGFHFSRDLGFVPAPHIDADTLPWDSLATALHEAIVAPHPQMG